MEIKSNQEACIEWNAYIITDVLVSFPPMCSMEIFPLKFLYNIRCFHSNDCEKIVRKLFENVASISEKYLLYSNTFKVWISKILSLIFETRSESRCEFHRVCGD